MNLLEELEELAKRASKNDADIIRETISKLKHHKKPTPIFYQEI